MGHCLYTTTRRKTTREWENAKREYRESNVAVNCTDPTFSSSSRRVLLSSNSNSSSVIPTPNLKQIAVSISHPPSSHVSHPYPQCPKHMAAISALLLLPSSRSRAPREYQRLIGVLIASAFSKKEILPQNPCIGGAKKQKYRNVELCAIVSYKKLFITLKHWYCLNKLTLKGLSTGLLSRKEKVEKKSAFRKTVS